MLFKFIHSKKMAVQSFAPGKRHSAEHCSGPPNARPFRRLKANSIALIINESDEMITVDTKPADTSLISITANFGPLEGESLAASASKRVWLAITYHSHGSKNGAFAIIT